MELQQQALEQIASSQVGLERPVDKLGRVSIPIEYRRALNLDDGGSHVLITRVGAYLLMRSSREEPHCAACGSKSNLIASDHQQAYLCSACLEGFKDAAIRKQEECIAE